MIYGGYTLLVTNQAELRGQFQAHDSLRMLWNSASLDPTGYYFVVEGSGVTDAGVGPTVRLVSSVEAVEALCKGSSPEFLSVNRVQLIAPPAMTKQPEISMQLLSEIRVEEGSEADPVYVFVTRDGQIFTSARR